MLRPPLAIAAAQVKGSHNGRKVYKFFLVDSLGRELLAATGEETADAHYNYASVPELEAKWGAVHGHTRKELTMW